MELEGVVVVEVEIDGETETLTIQANEFTPEAGEPRHIGDGDILQPAMYYYAHYEGADLVFALSIWGRKLGNDITRDPVEVDEGDCVIVRDDLRFVESPSEDDFDDDYYEDDEETAN